MVANAGLALLCGLGDAFGFVYAARVWDGDAFRWGQALRVAVNGTFSGVVNSQGCEHSSQVGNLSHGYLLNGRFDPGFEVDSPPSGTPGSDPRYADCQGAATCPCPSRPSRTCKSHNLVRTLSWSGNAASVVPYIFMLVVLAVRPNGMFGWKRIERV